MAVTDPLDARLLAALADLGKAAVHELAAKVGMDPREAAARLVALSGSGLPLLVGVECDARALRAAAAGWQPPGGMPPQAPPMPQPQPPAPGPPAPGPPSGGFPSQGPTASHGGPSGPHQVHGGGSGPYQVQGGSGPHHVPAGPSGPHQIPAGPSGSYQVPGGVSGQYQVQGTPSAAYPAPAGFRPPQGSPPAPAVQGARSAAYPVQGTPSAAYPVPPAPDPVMSTWGPPQTASWARGDQDSLAAQAGGGAKSGKIGDALRSEGLEQEQLSVQLIEVQDPADYLFGAAGYSLEPGERSIVVHTEITNTGQIPFVSLPDNFLELITADGAAVGKAPVSLTSRPPHKIGVDPGETLGGHTVYILPETTQVTMVRWSPQPEPDHRTLTWSIDD